MGEEGVRIVAMVSIRGWKWKQVPRTSKETDLVMVRVVRG